MITLKLNSKEYLLLAKKFSKNQFKLKEKKLKLDEIIEVYKQQLSILEQIKNYKFKTEILPLSV